MSHAQHSVKKIVVAVDHGGFEMKRILIPHIESLGFVVEDCGAHIYDPDDDFPEIIAVAARKVSEDPQRVWGIIGGGSGQGEAMVANRFPHVRCAVYYGASGTQTDASGQTLSLITSTRDHNDANMLSLGFRFLSEAHMKEAVTVWLKTPFSNHERHIRRNAHIDRVV